MKKHTIEEAVRYVETDAMGIVHHSTYLFWFEVARTSLLAEAGYPYHELEAAGTMFPVIEYGARMTGSSAYGDKVRLDAWISQLRSRSVEFSYEVFVRDEKIVTGRSFHLCVDADHKPKRLHPEVIQALEAYVATK